MGQAADSPAIDWSLEQGQALARAVLNRQPYRLAHSLLAGQQARRLVDTVAPMDGPLLVAAAVLHDIGYAPELRQTGFHPIDGARYLLDTGAPYRLAALVAHHSEARLLAAAAGLTPELAEFDREESRVSDALTYADMTAGPTGTPMSVVDRLVDIAERHSDDDPALLAARLERVPYLLAAAERVGHRLDHASDPGSR
ncbi:MAG: HD domain-containing protein [Jatrophihabitantaceae bacterium]